MGQKPASQKGQRTGAVHQPYFKWFAKRWLRFHGKWIPTPPPRQPFAGQQRDFEQYMKTEMGLSRETVQGRIWRSAKFLRWYSSQRKSLRRISLRDVDKYFALQAKHLAVVALANVADALRAFFRYAERRSWCEGWIASNIKNPPIRRNHLTPGGPPWSEVVRLVRSTNGESQAERRAKAILLLVSSYGLRNCEVIRLMLSDFDWDKMVFTVLRAKRGRIQQFPIGTELSDALLQYIRHARPQCSVPNVFVNRHIPYKPMVYNTVSRIVNLRMNRLQISSPKKGPYSLRHACATRLLEKGASLQEIADFLGHRDSRSVGIYAKFDAKALAQVSDLDLCGRL